MPTQKLSRVLIAALIIPWFIGAVAASTINLLPESKEDSL